MQGDAGLVRRFELDLVIHHCGESRTRHEKHDHSNWVGIYPLARGTGKQTGYIELGRSHKFNILAGLAVPFGEGRVWLTG